MLIDDSDGCVPKDAEFMKTRMWLDKHLYSIHKQSGKIQLTYYDDSNELQTVEASSFTECVRLAMNGV